MNIGKAIKELRKSKDLSQEELANKAGMAQASLSKIENGKRPGIITLNKISEALQVPESLIYAMGLERDDVPENKRELYEQLFPIIKNMIEKIAE
jgi:transcriptional regulator with XRE-family HTH domain